MVDNKPFGDCSVDGCAMGAMKGMITCGFHGAPVLEKLYPPVPNALEMANLGTAHVTYAAFRAQGWTDAQLIQFGYAFGPDNINSAQYWKEYACGLVDAARRAGYIIRVEQVPCEPLSMGNHHDFVTVYEVRK